MKYIVLILIIIAAILAITEILRLKREIKLLKSQDFEYLKHSAEHLQDLRTFKHDYKNMIFGLKTLLETGEYQKATEYLSSMDESFTASAESLTTYSDNTIINAILNRLAQRCEKESVAFEAAVTVGNDLPLSELDISTIFSNLADNAYEAVMRQTEGERFISFSVSRREKWLTVNIENSFDGVLYGENGTFSTVKKDKFSHGHGLKSVKKAVEAVRGAIFKAEADTDEKAFRISLIFPR